MRLVLFDIDGTLLLTGSVGQNSARDSLVRVFGTSGRVDEIYPGGRTIDGIFRDTMLDAGFTEEAFLAKRGELYDDFLAEFRNRIQNGNHDIKPLPGALELVKSLVQDQDVLLGLLTGNHEITAREKLEIAGFDHDWFKVGAYGDESTDRVSLVPLAQQRASHLLGTLVDSQYTVVIGDTARDVECARENGARSIVVATGTDDIEMLRQSQPDYLFPDFRNTQDVLAAITGT